MDVSSHSQKDPQESAAPAAPLHDAAARRMLGLFEEQSFLRRIRRMMAGFGAAPDSGAYKLARMEAQRLSAPALAVLLPILVVLLLLNFADTSELERRPVVTEIVEPDELEPLDPLDDLEPPPIEFEPPDLPDMDMAKFDPLAPATPQDATVTDIPQNLSQVIAIRSPIMMRNLFSTRTEAGRQEGLRRHSGRHGPATEAAVIKALEWLKANQQDDGSWVGAGTARTKCGMTGFGLLTFLAHGETPGSERYGETVLKAIQYMMSIQRPDGQFRETEGGERGGVYAHGLATYALCEAYALTRIPMLQPVVEKAIAVIVKGQRPDGGYDYRFAQGGGARDRCTSVAGWMAQAMKAAYLAGIEVEGLSEAMAKAADGFKLQHLREGNFLYSSQNRATRASMTPIATLCLQLLGHARSSEVRSGLGALSIWSPDWANPDLSGGKLETLYIWYYATQAFFHEGGAQWQRWNDRYAPMIVKNQNEDGSWTWDKDRSSAYGPVYATTLNALSLMVYYRYLPTYQTPEILADVVQDADDVPVQITF